LIHAFNAQKNKKYGRKSLQKTNKSTSVADEPKSESRKKRGRLSKGAKDDSDDADASGEETTTRGRSAKRAKKDSAAQSRSVSKKKKADPSPELDELQFDGFTNMDKWMDMESWEDLVEVVDTIEREDGKDLSVYFTL
jgi:hypothetical protein